MSTAILSLSENGELQKLNDKWLSKKSCGSQGSHADSEQLELQSFWGLFLISGIACFIALIIYFCLMLHQFKRYAPEESDSSQPSSSRSARLQTFLSFADEKVDKVKSKSKRKREELSLNGFGKETESMDGSERRIQRDISLERQSYRNTWEN